APGRSIPSLPGASGEGREGRPSGHYSVPQGILCMTTSSGPPDKPTWHGSASGPSPRRPAPPSRRNKVLAIGAVMLVLVGAIAGLIYMINPVTEPNFLAVWIDQYGDLEIPVNAWAEQDRKAVLDVNWQAKQAFTKQERHQLEAQLRELQGQHD